MNQKHQLIQKITDLEVQLNTVKEKLKNYEIKPEEAEIGDVLEDGSHVFLKSDDFILVTADPKLDVVCQYDESRQIILLSQRGMDVQSPDGF